MCQDLFNPRRPGYGEPRPQPQRYQFCVAIRQEGQAGNVEAVFVNGTSVSLDPHWVKVLDDRDTVAVFQASLVRRITRLQAETPPAE